MIDDEASFRHVAIYERLKMALRRAEHRFKIAGVGENSSWDRVLFLNLTFWSSSDEASVLCDEHIAPDVIAHTALHHVVGHEVARVSAPGAPSPAALLFSEAIASAFDLYLVGRLLGHAPESSFLETQVLAMKDVAGAAGLDDPDFAALLTEVADSPERAFADLRALLFDACTALYASADTEAALRAFGKLDAHRFAPLLHHYELSNWILYARAHDRTDGSDRGSEDEPADSKTRVLDFGLRERPDALDWLSREWVAPALR
jgi:hypothetical protein